jgi:hypothetical protein
MRTRPQNLYGRLAKVERLLCPKIEDDRRKAADIEAIIAAGDALRARATLNPTRTMSEAEEGLLWRADEIRRLLETARQRIVSSAPQIKNGVKANGSQGPG